MHEEKFTALTIKYLEKSLSRSIQLEDLSKPYDALGADSMDMVVLASELEKLVEFPIDPEVFLRFESVEKAISFLCTEVCYETNKK